ncbi:phosphatidylglycerol lysyltransferase domain-containing protein [Nakamurella lactea]|uniref:phosphatidylglycerol lysyltransferase domain-containing protein n=1 Tax=Nakamurella lactea TaxID=459515 RepID=UPI0012B61B3E|nr:phosphatidylglycerol lysyltransferase domain-containing protein [Nakamurella lactea]
MSRLIALCAGLYGLLTMARGIWPVHHLQQELLGVRVHIVPGPVGSALTVGLGAAIVLVAHGLARRKRRAWQVAAGVLGVLTLLDAFRPKDFDSLIVSVALLLLLVACRPQFTGRTDATLRGSAAGASAVILAMGFLVGMVAMGADRQHLVGDTGLGARAVTVLRGFLGVGGPVRFEAAHRQAQFELTLVAFTLLVIAVAGYLLLRAAEPAPFRTPAEQAAVTELLERHGPRDSLGYFALRADKSVVVSPTGKAAITYRVITGVAMVSADPLGEPDAWPPAIAAYLALCRRNSWVPAVLGCSAEGALAFRRQGLSVLEIGDEALVDASSFSLEGRSMRNVRQMVNRVRRNGYQVEVRRIEQLSGDELGVLEECAARWRIGRLERGYSMALGRFGGPGCVIVIASSAEPDGSPRPRALLQFVPWGNDGWSLDLMRRDPAADPGMNDFMIVSALQQAGQFGISRVSLNFAMLRQAFAQGERLGAGWAARGWAGLLRQLSRWFQLESLYRFNAKFGPTWVPRYLCFRGIASLPRVGYAAMEAEAFVQRPVALKRLSGRTVVSGDQLVPLPRTSALPRTSTRRLAD